MPLPGRYGPPPVPPPDPSPMPLPSPSPTPVPVAGPGAGAAPRAARVLRRRFLDDAGLRLGIGRRRGDWRLRRRLLRLGRWWLPGGAGSGAGGGGGTGLLRSPAARAARRSGGFGCRRPPPPPPPPGPGVARNTSEPDRERATAPARSSARPMKRDQEQCAQDRAVDCGRRHQRHLRFAAVRPARAKSGGVVTTTPSGCPARIARTTRKASACAMKRPSMVAMRPAIDRARPPRRTCVRLHRGQLARGVNLGLRHISVAIRRVRTQEPLPRPRRGPVARQIVIRPGISRWAAAGRRGPVSRDCRVGQAAECRRRRSCGSP